MRRAPKGRHGPTCPIFHRGLQRCPIKLNRNNFSNQRRADSSCLPGLEAGRHGQGAVARPSGPCSCRGERGMSHRAAAEVIAVSPARVSLAGAMECHSMPICWHHLRTAIEVSGAWVRDDVRRFGPDCGERIELAHHPKAGQRGVGDQRQALSAGVVDHRDNSEAPSIRDGIRREIWTSGDIVPDPADPSPPRVQRPIGTLGRHTYSISCRDSGRSFV